MTHTEADVTTPAAAPGSRLGWTLREAADLCEQIGILARGIRMAAGAGDTGLTRVLLDMLQHMFENGQSLIGAEREDFERERT
jgi:hypothetical protein